MFKHLVSASQFTSVGMLDDFFEHVRKIITASNDNKNFYPLARGRVMATWFEERSTRTRLSFESAMLRLGGSVISMADVLGESSVGKGETWDDAVRTMCQLADIVVARTIRQGAAATASQIATVPFINAGDGSGEHPTQALLDVYTIREHFGDKKDLSVALVGDLKYSRTVHSLLKLLSLYQGITFHVLAPSRLYLDPRELLQQKNCPVRRHESMDELVHIGPDVLYLTRNQLERHNEEASIGTTYLPKAHYLRRDQVQKLPETSIVMHPLPRGPELTSEIDADPRAAYWKQVRYGLYVRMALLDLLMAS